MGDKYFVLWHDNDFDFALWVFENTVLREIASRVLIRKIPGNNSSSLLATAFTSGFDYSILPYIKFSKPDILLQQIEDNESKLLMATEFMTQTPQHDHLFQRFERIYDNSGQSVPSFFVLPHKKIKYERGSREAYTKVSYTPNPLGIHTYLKTTKINRVPTMPFFWPDFDGALVYDKKHPTAPGENEQIKRWIGVFNDIVAGTFSNSMEIAGAKEQLKFLQGKYTYQGKNFFNIDYDHFITSYQDVYGLERIRIIDTEVAIKEMELDTKNLDPRFLSRKKTCIFSYTSQLFRTDPYCGYVCAYSNLFCLDDNGAKQMNFVHRPLGITAQKAGAIAKPANAIIEDLDDCPLNQKTLDLDRLEDIKRHLKEGCIYNRSKAERIFRTIPDINVFEDLIQYNKLANE